MRRRLGIDVTEGNHGLVLKDDRRRNLLACDAAEDTAVGHWTVGESTRRTARAAMPAVSKRRTLRPSDTGRQSRDISRFRSSSSSPPSGPTATAMLPLIWR